jgi:hypothetical protein
MFQVEVNRSSKIDLRAREMSTELCGIPGAFFIEMTETSFGLKRVRFCPEHAGPSKDHELFRDSSF